MIACTGCGKPLGEAGGCGAAASISGSIMGDEQTETFFLCPHCDSYTAKCCLDRFCGETTVSLKGPLSRADGDAIVALIRRCSEPWDKKCRCAAHREYFGGWLD